MKKIVFLLFALPLIGYCQSSDWSIYRGDQNLSGVSNIEIPDRLEVKWTFKANDVIKSSPVFGGDLIFVGCDDGSLYALNKKGEQEWKFQVETSFEAPPMYLDGLVYIGSLEGVLYAIDAKTGEEKWSYETEGQISGSVNWAYSSDQKTKQILFGSYDFFLHSVDAQS